jgi:2-methylisocitrate lyase-like PEP mutase family enzyme
VRGLLDPGGGGPSVLRALLADRQGWPVVAVGAYDAWSARLVEAAGFHAVYMTGFGASASLLGRPDAGLLTATEMADQARRICQAVAVPVVADADTGYGNPLNVIRTVQTYEAAGVAALHLEDQVAPKRCGHVAGKQVIPTEEMVAKIDAAVAARRDPDLVVIARTDARAPLGLDAALDRARAYRDAGADMLFVEAPESEWELEQVAETLSGTPLLANWAEGGRTPPVDLARLAELGFALVIFPVSTLLAATKAVEHVLRAIRRDGTPAGVMGELQAFTAFLDAIGMPEVGELEQRFAPRRP